MNKVQLTLIYIIKKSQFNTETVISFDIDLNELFEEASKQSVLGIVASEIPDNISQNEKWQRVQLNQMASYIRYCYAEDELNSIMNEAGISYAILKGNAAAINYKDPSMRAMGDIDFIVGSDVFEKTKELLIANAFALVPDSDKHPRHIEFKKNGVLFELHRKFSHEDVDIEHFVVEGLNNVCVGRIDNHEFSMLPKLANGLVLLDHMRNHLKSGLGLRQAVDWMMYVYHNLDDEFWEKEFCPVVREKGMDTLAISATRMCQIYLGLPETITWCKEADEKVCEQLMECLLESGNFGRKNGQGQSVESVSTSMKRVGLFRWLQYAGEHNWKAYHKHHWLKPFCWFYQIFRYMGQGIKSGRSRKQLKDDLNRSEQRYELLKKLGIE